MIGDTFACEDKRAIGEPCSRRSQCLSGNCSVSSFGALDPGDMGQCEAAAGTSCTGGECSICLDTGGAEGSFCHLPCGIYEGCGSRWCGYNPYVNGGDGVCYDRCYPTSSIWCDPGYTCQDDIDHTLTYCQP